MKNVILGIVFTLLIVLSLRYYEQQQEEQQTTFQSAQLLQEQIKNVGKLIVTEGHFSEVITYKNAKKHYMDLYTSEKKALVIVNAQATVAYDLSKIEYSIAEETKTLTITTLPKAEININPDIQYYDIKQEFLNPFGPEDHNKIKDKVNKELHAKIEASSLKSNAENRLISELQQLFVLTNSLGWTLHYNKTIVTQHEYIEQLLLLQH